MAKKITGYVKLQIAAGKATPQPPVGTALGPRGVNIMEFCKAFNAQTQDMNGAPIPVMMTVYADRTFTFELKQPPASYFLKQAAGLTKGSAAAGATTVGSVTMEQVRDIAKAKMKDLNANDLEAAARIVAGSARSMGLEIKE